MANQLVSALVFALFLVSGAEGACSISEVKAKAPRVPNASYLDVATESATISSVCAIAIKLRSAKKNRTFCTGDPDQDCKGNFDLNVRLTCVDNDKLIDDGEQIAFSFHVTCDRRVI